MESIVMHRILNFIYNNNIDIVEEVFKDKVSDGMLNHGINDIEGYSLVDLPKERYGNSYNWGSYILSLNPIEQFKLLSHLSLYCHEQIDKSSKNREQLKRAKLKTT